MIFKSYVLAMLGLKAASHFHVPKDATHSDKVHDLINQETVALARFELRKRASERITAKQKLGERLHDIVGGINDDAAKLRTALGDAMRREGD